MDLVGKIIAQMPARSGTSARGEWTAQDFVLETIDSGNYPRKMVFSVFGSDRLQRFAIQIGQVVNVSFDIDAHEYQGRWFNSIRAYDVRPYNPAAATAATPFPPQQPAAQPAAAPQAATAPFPPAQEPAAENAADDLPF